MSGAEFAFWACAAIVGYAYLGYPAIVCTLARLRPKPVRKGPVTPSITVLIAAHNEEARIAAKIENCLALSYPPQLLDLVVISDGSIDRTPGIVAEYASRFPGRVRSVSIPERAGKANALNAGAALASGEILLLADARQLFEPYVAQELACNFADPEVGAVSGELILVEEGASRHRGGLGFYWRYEKVIREAESRFASSIGYTGAVAAVRRSLFTSLPADTLLDDLVMPLRVIGRGYRVVFEPNARAVDWVSTVPGREFDRKVRTLAGVIQTHLEMRRRVGRLRASVWWQFASHKTLRLVVPYAVVTGLIMNAFLEGPLYRVLLLGQVVAYGLGILGLLETGHTPLRGKVLSLPSTFLLLNSAAVVAAFRYAAGRRLDLWRAASPTSGDSRATRETPTDPSAGLAGRRGL